MKKLFLISLFYLLLVPVIGQQQNAYKFYFGSDKTNKGYIKVSPETKFSYQTGYGFSQGSAVKAVTRKGKNKMAYRW